MPELSIICLLLLILVFILLALIVAFLYNKYLKKRVDRIYDRVIRRDNNRQTTTDDDVIEGDIESRMDAYERSRPQPIANRDTFVKQKHKLRSRVDDNTQTCVKEVIECSKCLAAAISPKCGESSGENETIISANSERTVSYMSSTPKQTISPTTKTVSSGGGEKSVYSASKSANTLPKRALFMRSPNNNCARSEDIITEMDAIIDESFEALKSTIDCMNYDTLRYSCEELS